jgi:hypothetical protein
LGSGENTARTGVRPAIASRIPSCPYAFAPQQYTCSSSPRAHELSPPHHSCVARTGSAALAATTCVAVVPSPIWNWSPAPQQYTSPAIVRAHE